MKARQWMSVVLVLSFSILGYGQGVNVMEIQVGTLNPKGTPAGLIFGGSYGISVDEAVDLSLGVSYFFKNYSKITQIADQYYVSGVSETTQMKELEYNTSLLPISANVTVRFPIQPPIYWYLGGGVSYQFLFNKENNYQENVSETRTYNGFGWQARLGGEYNIGSRSSLLLEAFYNGCKPKGNKEKKQGLPVWDEVDLSGLGFKAGLRLEFF